MNKDKIDSNLGNLIANHLTKIGVQTPITENKLTEQEKLHKLESNFKEVLEILGLDLTDDSLIDTPKRLAKMYLNELCYGLKPETFPKCTVVDNKFNYNDLIIEKCTIKSLCEHHFVYFGTSHNPQELGCWVAYIPKDKVLGLSKINRIVNYFSRRPQIQERLAHQIAESLKYILNTDDVAVVIKAQHFCVLTRGVEDENGFTVTSSLHGLFMKEQSLRQELMSLVK